MRPNANIDARGASLVAVLMIVVMLGGLAALVMLGLSSMTESSDVFTAKSVVTPRAGSGDTATPKVVGASAACAASAAAAEAASSVHFANNGGAYPVTWPDLTSANPPNFVLPEHVVVNGRDPKQLDGNGWTLVITGGGTSAPTFTCK